MKLVNWTACVSSILVGEIWPSAKWYSITAYLALGVGMIVGMILYRREVER